MTRYCIISPADTPSLEEMMDALPAWRRDKAARFRFKQGQWECAASYLLLCRMLREHFGINSQPTFAEGPHGKPSLIFADHDATAQSLHFNMSHCKNGVACVVSSDSEVGIDIECTGRYKESLARYCMSEEEVSDILASDTPDLVFTRLWTQKEALLKLTGEGITDDIKHILHSERMQGVKMETHYDAAHGYCYSIATRNI